MEAYVICSIPTATSPINDIEFAVESGALGKDQVLRSVDPMPADVAAYFAEIPGYRIEPAGGAPLEPKAPTPRSPGRARPPAAEIVAQSAAAAPAAPVVEEPTLAPPAVVDPAAAGATDGEADGEIF